MENINRSAFLYLDPRPLKEAFAQCSTCKMFLKDHGLCSLHGKDVKITGGMSCGLYVPGGPAEESELEHVSKAVTPEESGLVDRQVRCENCTFLKGDSCGLFQQLNDKFPTMFSLKTGVDKHGCCNAQTPKAKFSIKERMRGAK